MIPHWQLLRPHQWVKNTACLAGVVFGGRLAEPLALQQAALTFVVFSLAASAVYVFNDIQDLPRDRLHPRKCQRPLPSGTVSLPQAWAIAGGLGVGAAVLAGGLGPAGAWCAALYLGLNLAYSLQLKHVVLVDVHCIALGFVLRLLAGIYALGDRPPAGSCCAHSFWLCFWAWPNGGESWGNTRKPPGNDPFWPGTPCPFSIAPSTTRR
ncbi:MAG: UbiA prenyltransferase family protein [Oscillatoriales cyanobacterium SM2_1_8]|nr:UbiA prenyltransferase family protein [Oscillatoriales cyanobacterium SM2_1_8]